MASLRLYRDFYCIQYVPNSTGETYTLIDVYNLSAETRHLGTNDLVENLSIQHESLGKYFVNIDQYQYDINEIYEVHWLVNYTPASPLKKLITRFRLYPTIVGNNIEMRLETQEIDIRLDNQDIELRNDDKQEIRINNDDLRLEGDSDGIILKT
jgi:hypothetical protein